MNIVTINGKKYTAPDGCSVSVVNNKVYFDGKLAEDFNDWKEKNIEIKITGNCNELKTDIGNINIEGNVEKDVTTDTGNINVRGDIKGNVTTDTGNIKSHHIFGNVKTDCGYINGTHNINNSIISGKTSINYNYSKSWFKKLIQEIFD